MTVVALGPGEPVAVIGDVHGQPDPLQAALGELARSGRRIVCVGDYVNRGPDSRGVLDLLVQAREELGDRLVLLRGNHEVALLQLLATGESASFLRHRGATTIRSYIPEPGPQVLEDFRRSFPSEHRRLLKETLLCAEGPEVLVSHAGYCPDRPTSRTEHDVTTGSWRRLVAVARPPRPLVVVGHYTQTEMRPYLTDHLIGLDTGCGTLPSAPLSVLLLPERTIHAYSP